MYFYFKLAPAPCTGNCSTYHCYKGGPEEPPAGLATAGCPVYSHPAQLAGQSQLRPLHDLRQGAPLLRSAACTAPVPSDAPAGGQALQACCSSEDVSVRLHLVTTCQSRD